MMSSGTPACFGQKKPKPIAVGDNEFGEIYHIAAALALDERCTARLVAEDKSGSRLQFLRLFADEGRVKLISEKEYNDHQCDFERAGKSTDVYLCKWSPTSWQNLKDMLLKHGSESLGSVEDYMSKQVGRFRARTLLIWIRNRSDYRQGRNSTVESTLQLISLAHNIGLRPILAGHSIGPFEPALGNLIECWKSQPFDKSDSILRQLLLFHLLRERHRLVASVGMMSGGMDGPALFLGVPTVSFATRGDSCRIDKIAKKVSYYHVLHLEPNRYSDGNMVVLSSLLDVLRGK